VVKPSRADCCARFLSIISKQSALAGLAAIVLTSSCARHYRAQGIVLAVDPSAQKVTISHRAIPGYMEAMAMPFGVESAQDLKQLAPGSRIQFELKITRQASTVRHIRVEQAATGDVPVPKAEGKIAVGEAMPDFTLTSQDGSAVRLSDYRGHFVAVDFIYTRCPLPDVCPRLSANFARLQKRLGPRIALLSITLDPEFDTPAVLTEYGRRWGADPRIWRFLTGAPDQVQKIAGEFGVVYWPEENAITHTSSTALIDGGGKLAALVEGSSFTSQQLLDLVEATERAR
jgi:protein SCO1